MYLGFLIFFEKENRETREHFFHNTREYYYSATLLHRIE